MAVPVPHRAPFFVRRPAGRVPWPRRAFRGGRRDGDGDCAVSATAAD